MGLPYPKGSGLRAFDLGKIVAFLFASPLDHPFIVSSG